MSTSILQQFLNLHDTVDLTTGRPEVSKKARSGSRSLAEIDGPRVLIFYRGLW